jgi:transaldolase
MADFDPNIQYKSPLFQMTQTTPTCLWNDSASIEELTYSIEHGAVGATCNPSIVVSVLKNEMIAWKGRIKALAETCSQASEDEIAWKVMAASPFRLTRGNIATPMQFWRRQSISTSSRRI